MKPNKPYSITIFLPEGDPDGIRTIEKSNWIGAGLVIPRALLNEAKGRKELSRTGVYVLVGPLEDSLPRLYVGEGDPIKPRLEQHAAKKDFWTSCIAFTSKDENLNKAHVQYLESKLISTAAQAKRCVLDNVNGPALPSLSEADAADAEGFLSEIMLCFPVLGINAFTTGAVIQKNAKWLSLSAKGITAEGMESSEGFVVRAGSGAVKNEVSSTPAYHRQLRAALLANGVLKAAGDGLEFTQDYVFPSPSFAASVIQGRPANGRLDWKTKDGKTLKDVQEGAANP